MKRKAVSGIVLTLLLIGMLTLAFNVQLVNSSGTIYIRADGSVEGTTYIVSGDNVTYVFAADINDSIVVERSNTIIDGNEYALQATGGGDGITLEGRSNVTIKNMEIETFNIGIKLDASSNNNTICGTNITNHYYGIFLTGHSSNNTICGNNIAGALYGHNGICIVDYSSDNRISGNNITNTDNGILLCYSSSNTISGNNITNNGYSLFVYCESSDNKIHNNSFIDNQQLWLSLDSINNVWDDGYRSGGNYWGDYVDVDLYSGPNQDVPGSDGIWDDPYVIDGNNQDRYPLVNPWTQASLRNVHLVVRGLDDRIWYRVYDTSSDAWESWNALPSGSTGDSPAAATVADTLYVVVRGMDGSSLWFSSVNLTDSSFSGWTLLSGSTPSIPTLSSNGTVLVLTVRGDDNRIYYRFYTIASQIWTGWSALPSGTTPDSPAATLIGDTLHIVVRGMGGNTLWYSNVYTPTETFSGWTWLDGFTPSVPTLTGNSTALALVVRGGDDRVYYRYYTIDTLTWDLWNVLPSGATLDSPGAAILENTLYFAVRGLDGHSVWQSSIDLDTSTFSGWTGLSGSTPSKPTLTRAVHGVDITVTNPPTSNSGTGWNNPDNAYGDDSDYADSDYDGDQQTYGGYGFGLTPDAAVSQVLVGLDAWAYGVLGFGMDNIRLEIYDGSWHTYSPDPISLSMSEITYWCDVTELSSGGWTGSEVNSVQTRVTHVGEFESSPVYLDWIRVEVKYTI